MSGCSDTERRYILDTGWFVAPCPCDVLTRPSSNKSFRSRSTSTEVTVRINAKKTCSNCGVQRLTAPPGGCNFDACLVGLKEPISRDSCPNLSRCSKYVLMPGSSTHQLPFAARYVPCSDSASVSSVPAAVLDMACRGRPQSACADGARSAAAVQSSRSWHMIDRETADGPLCDRVTKGSCPTRLDESPPWSPRLSRLLGHSSPTFHLLNDTATRPVSPQCHPSAMSRVSPTSAMSRVSPTSAMSRVSPPTPPLITSPSVLAARQQCLFASSSSDDLHSKGCSGRTSPIYWELERPRSHIYSGPALVKSGHSPVTGLSSSMRKSYSDSGHSSPGVKSLSSSPEVVVRSRVSTECGCGSHGKCPQKTGQSPDHARSLSSPLDVFSAIWRPGRRSHSSQVNGHKKHKAVSASVQSPGLDKQHRCQTPPRVLSPTNEVVTCEVIADI